MLVEAIAGGRSPVEELEAREELAELIGRLQSLPEPQRAAIVMRELEGLSHEEIATALGLSGGAARQAIYRARQTLRAGFGMLLPAPVLKALLSGSSSSSVEAATGAVGVGGAGVALKAATATVLVAGAVGAGVAIDHGHRHKNPTSAEVGSVRTDAPLRVSKAGPQPELKRDTSAEPERGGSSENRRGRDAGEQDGSIEQGGGRSGRGGSPTHSSGGPGDEVRDGKDTTEPGNKGDGGGGTSGKDDGQGTGGSVGGSSGPGGGSGDSKNGGGSSNSGPGDGTTSTSDDEFPSSDSSGSNSGPDSGDGGAVQSSGSDDLRDPHGASVFSVQETQP